jgi:hypothetical protein
VQCFYTFQVARTLDFRIHAILFNHASAEMDYITGIGPISPQMQVPDIPQGPKILNNIKVDNSVVGAINTGTVQKIDVAVSVLKDAGSKDISEALTLLAQAIANAAELDAAQKNETLEQISFVAAQAAAAAPDRKPALVLPILSAIGKVAGVAGSALEAWNHAFPLIKSYFGL